MEGARLCVVVLVRGCTAWRPEPRSSQSQDTDKHMGFAFQREVLKQWRKESQRLLTAITALWYLDSEWD